MARSPGSSELRLLQRIGLIAVALLAAFLHLYRLNMVGKNVFDNICTASR